MHYNDCTRRSSLSRPLLSIFDLFRCLIREDDRRMDEWVPTNRLELDSFRKALAGEMDLPNDKDDQPERKVLVCDGFSLTRSVDEAYEKKAR